MKHNFFRHVVVLISGTAVWAAFCLLSTPTFGQTDGHNEASTGKYPNAKSVKATPHLADGHPDLSGLWGAFYENFPVDKVGGVTYIGFGKRPVNKPPDPNDPDAVQLLLSRKDGIEGGESTHDNRIADYKAHPNHFPPYKPELLDKVAYSDLHAIELDPDFTCHPAGVPRIGPPDQIVETPGQVVFLYGRGSKNSFRIIPTDNRPHRDDLDPSDLGDSVAHWDGNTLVVDVTNIDDSTWLGNDGWFHSDAMHVIERLSRDGDTLTYQVTVDDPKMFTHPWIREPRKIRLTTDPAEALYEAPPCHEEESAHMASHEHH